MEKIEFIFHIPFCMPNFTSHITHYIPHLEIKHSLVCQHISEGELMQTHSHSRISKHSTTINHTPKKLLKISMKHQLRKSINAHLHSDKEKKQKKKKEKESRKNITLCMAFANRDGLSFPVSDEWMSDQLGGCGA